MDKEDVHIYNGASLGPKKEEIGSFVVMWMNLESVTQCEVSQEEKKTNVIAYMWALAKGFRQPYLQGRNRDPEHRRRHREGRVG